MSIVNNYVICENYNSILCKNNDACGRHGKVHIHDYSCVEWCSVYEGDNKYSVRRIRARCVCVPFFRPVVLPKELFEI